MIGDLLERRRTLDELFAESYDELRSLAAAVARHAKDVTTTPAALVSQAWLKLSHKPPIAMASQEHFKRIAGRAIRQALVDEARWRNAAKRNGIRIPLDDSGCAKEAADRLVVELTDALRELERIDTCRSMVIKYRFFDGLSITETAKAMDISAATANREWRDARAWLRSRLSPCRRPNRGGEALQA